MARYFDVHPQNPQARSIGQLVALLRDGGLIAYPTDSGYALGAAFGNVHALARIREIRHLDERHHFTVVCRDFAQMGPYVQVSNAMYRTVTGSAGTPLAFTVERDGRSITINAMTSVPIPPPTARPVGRLPRRSSTLSL